MLNTIKVPLTNGIKTRVTKTRKKGKILSLQSAATFAIILSARLFSIARPLFAAAFIPIPAITASFPAISGRAIFSFNNDIPLKQQLASSSSVTMNDIDIDGKLIASTIRKELKERVLSLPTTPGLAVVLVGSRRDSATYVRMKKKACDECGIFSYGHDFPDEQTSQQELLTLIGELNSDPKVHGILVQLPLPPHIDEGTILSAIDPFKDVDGLHPLNLAKLCTTGTHHGARLNWSDLPSIPFHLPCTPQGCLELLDRIKYECSGKRAVIVGRSNLVGLPVSMMLMHRNATVTIVHSKTPNAASIVRDAHIVVAAIGRAEMIGPDWIGPECEVIIDVGINDIEDKTRKAGYRLVGDVDYKRVKAAQETAGVKCRITPVPGGVGPMTIAMLLRNTVNSCERVSVTKA